MTTRREKIDTELYSVRKLIATLQRKKLRLLAERKAIPRKKRAKVFTDKVKSWLPDDEQLLRAYYPGGGIRACAKLFPNRSRKAIQQHCYRLRIKRVEGAQKPPLFFRIPPRPPRAKRSFDEQLARVERGEATIVPVFRPWLEPTRTLGGVVGEMV